MAALPMYMDSSTNWSPWQSSTAFYFQVNVPAKVVVLPAMSRAAFARLSLAMIQRPDSFLSRLRWKPRMPLAFPILPLFVRVKKRPHRLRPGMRRLARVFA